MSMDPLMLVALAFAQALMVKDQEEAKGQVEHREATATNVCNVMDKEKANAPRVGMEFILESATQP